VKTDQIVAQHRFEGVHFCAEDLRDGHKLESLWNENEFSDKLQRLVD